MAREKISKPKVKRTKKSKALMITLTAVGATSLAAACIFAGTRNPVEPTIEPTEPIVEKVSFNTEDFFEDLCDHLEEVAEYSFSTKVGKPYAIKGGTYSPYDIIADQNSLKVYSSFTENSGDYATKDSVMEFEGETYTAFYNQSYLSFVDKVNNATATQEEADQFIVEFENAIVYDNLKDIAIVEKVDNQYTEEISKNVVKNFINSDTTISEQDKVALTQSINYSNEFQIVGSHFILTGSDASTRKYKYNYTALILINGYEFYVNTTVYSKSKTANSELLSQLLNDLYQTNPEKFSVISGKIENFQLVMSEYSNKVNTEREEFLSNLAKPEEEAEME